VGISTGGTTSAILEAPDQQVAQWLSTQLEVRRQTAAQKALAVEAAQFRRVARSCPPVEMHLVLVARIRSAAPQQSIPAWVARRVLVA